MISTAEQPEGGWAGGGSAILRSPDDRIRRTGRFLAARRLHAPISDQNAVGEVRLECLLVASGGVVAQPDGAAADMCAGEGVAAVRMKRLRAKFRHLAGRLVRHGRQEALVIRGRSEASRAALPRLRALPAPG